MVGGKRLGKTTRFQGVLISNFAVIRRVAARIFPEAYPEPSQTSKIECFTKIVNS